jgi:membrane-associated protease RseP (regulator of RpoE activity)
MDWYAVSAIVFIAILIVIFYRDRKNVKRESILLLRRTKRGKELLVRLGRRFPRFWKGVGFVAVGVGFAASVYFLYAIGENLAKLLTGEIKLGAGLVIPSLTQEVSIGPGYFAIPFWYWIISIAMLFVVHEGMHGIMAVREKIRIKTLGWGLLVVFLLAFVEPDEKQVAKKKPMQQLRFFAAGSFGNFLLAGLSVLIISIISVSMFTQAGVAYSGLMEGYPAERVNLSGVITGINSYDIRNITDFSAALDEIGPGETVTIYTMAGGKENRTFVLTTVQRPNATEESGFIGIAGVGTYLAIGAGLRPYSGLIFFIHELFFFVFLLNFAIAMVNLLPLKPFDGGRMWELVFKKIAPGHSRQLVWGLGLFTLFLLIGNFVVPFLVW